MSAETLRKAAAAIREASPTGTYGDPCGECGVTGAFLDAVADWLDSEAEAHLHTAMGPMSVYDAPGMDGSPAVLVARAYLGGEA